MSDQQDPTISNAPAQDLPDLQSTVDAALGRNPAPVALTPEPPAPPIAPIAPTAPEETPLPPTLPEAPSVTPMPSAPVTDETPLAFAPAPEPQMAAPTPITPPTELAPASEVPASVPPVVPPADLPPVAPAGEVKPKYGMKKIVAGVVAGLFLVFGLVGGLYAFGILRGVPPQIARVTEGSCQDDKDCKIYGANYQCQKNACINVGGNDGNSGGGGGRTECSKAADCGASGPNFSWDCQAGKCIAIPSNPVTCAADQLLCNGQCVKRDATHCNSCTDVCPSGFSVCEQDVALASGPYYCKTTTDSLCKNAGQEPCIVPVSLNGTGHTCCAKGYTCKSGVGCIAASPKPKPSDVSTPKPSPSPISSMACTGLTASKASPSIGDTVTFTCLGTATPAGTGITYKFRYSTDGGTTWNTLTTRPGLNTVDMKITACGTYSVQCQACATLNGIVACDPKWVGVQ